MKEISILRLEALRFTMEAVNAGRLSHHEAVEVAERLHKFLSAEKTPAKKRGK